MNGLTAWMARYRKFIMAAAAGLAILAAALSDGKVDGAEWVAVIGAVLGPFGVVLTPNAPKKP